MEDCADRAATGRGRQPHRPSRDTAHTAWDKDPMQQRGRISSALDDEPGGLQREHLVRYVEVWRVAEGNHLSRGIGAPGEDQCDDKRLKEHPHVGTAAGMIGRQSFPVRHRHMQMATALVNGVQGGQEQAVTLGLVGLRDRLVDRRGRGDPAVTAGGRLVPFVIPAIPERDAEHPPRSGYSRSRALHDEQEHRDEFDQSGGHWAAAWGIGRAECITSKTLRGVRSSYRLRGPQARWSCQSPAASRGAAAASRDSHSWWIRFRGAGHYAGRARF